MERIFGHLNGASLKKTKDVLLDLFERENHFNDLKPPLQFQKKRIIYFLK